MARASKVYELREKLKEIGVVYLVRNGSTEDGKPIYYGIKPGLSLESQSVPFGSCSLIYLYSLDGLEILVSIIQGKSLLGGDEILFHPRTMSAYYKNEPFPLTLGDLISKNNYPYETGA